MRRGGAGPRRPLGRINRTEVRFEPAARPGDGRNEGRGSDGGYGVTAELSGAGAGLTLVSGAGVGAGCVGAGFTGSAATTGGFTAPGAGAASGDTAL